MTKTATDTEKATINRFQKQPGINQNFSLAWLDPHMSGELDDEHTAILHQIQSLINTIHRFDDINKCLHFLHRVKNDCILLIVSGIFGQCIIPHIHELQQIDSIYVFCGIIKQHEQWAKQWTKVKGVFNQILPLYVLLREKIRQNDQNFISLSVVQQSNTLEQNLDQIDQSFMYTKILKEILLEIPCNEQSIDDFISYSTTHFGHNENELSLIKSFETNYSKHSPIYWYTRPCFIHSMLNRALRTYDVETIIKMGFFIKHLHNEINEIHRQQMTDEEKKRFIVYRGQGLAKNEFENLSKAKGGLVSFNNFLSTSRKRNVALEFSQYASNNPNVVAVLFKMIIDPSESTTPYACITNQSYYQGEEEILFSMHTIFRIGEMKQIDKNKQVYQVILTLTNTKNKQMNFLTELLRSETQGINGWHRLAMLLIKIGKYDKAEQIYKILFDLTNENNEKAIIYHRIGLIKSYQNDYEKAISSYEQALTLLENLSNTNGMDLANIYINIGHVYNKMSEYSNALSHYEKSLTIYEQHELEDQSLLAVLYNNIGLVYKHLGDYNQAFQFYEKAVKIEEENLLENHPTLAVSYKNIAVVYQHIGQYSKAIDYNEKALNIENKILPQKHPSLAITYNNIGSIYDTMCEYCKALSYYEKTLDIYQNVSTTNHADIALTCNNIGSVYKNLCNYSKALSFYQKALDMEKEVLSKDHPSLAITYNNIATVYDNLGEHSQALSSYEKAMEIYEKKFNFIHPLLAITYNNVGSVHDNMADYQKAISYYEKALKIQENTLPPNHPDLATTYNNIAVAYDKLNEHAKSINFFIKSIEICQTSLPLDHSDLANLYINLASTYEKSKAYSDSLSFYVKALEIRQRILPPGHVDLLTCYAHLSQLHQCLGQFTEALSFYKEFINAQENIGHEDNLKSTISFPHIEQILSNTDASINHDGTTELNISIDSSEYIIEAALRLTNFRRKLESIRKKCTPIENI